MIFLLIIKLSVSSTGKLRGEIKLIVTSKISTGARPS